VANPRFPDLPAPPVSHAAPAQPLSAGVVHSRTPSGPSHANSGDSSANLFASGEQGLWSYIQTLEDKVKQLTDRILTMEKTETTREAQVGYLTSEVASLRKQLETRQDPTGANNA